MQGDRCRTVELFLGLSVSLCSLHSPGPPPLHGNNLSNLTGLVEEMRARKRPRICRFDNIAAWTQDWHVGGSAFCTH